MRQPRLINTVSYIKIFSIGLPKTGNHSLKQWLIDCGFKGIRYPNRQQWSYLKHYDFVLDTPCNLYYQILFSIYPDAKFIYTYRSQNTWLKSWSAHKKNISEDSLSAWQVRNREFIDTWYQDINTHKKEAESFFKHRSELFLLNIESPDINGLADFLEISNPPPFLHLNATRF